MFPLPHLSCSVVAQTLSEKNVIVHVKMQSVEGTQHVRQHLEGEWTDKSFETGPFRLLNPKKGADMKHRHSLRTRCLTC